MGQERNTKNRRIVQINKLFQSQKDLLQDLSKQVTELPQINSCISTDSEQPQQVFSNRETTKGEPSYIFTDARAATAKT